MRVSLAGITVGKGCPGWRRTGQSEWQELSGGEGTLQSSLFAGQRGDSAQVFPDFDELRGVVLFSVRWVFQLEERDTRGEFGRAGCRQWGGGFLFSKAVVLGQESCQWGSRSPVRLGFTNHPKVAGVYQESRHRKESSRLTRKETKQNYGHFRKHQISM